MRRLFGRAAQGKQPVSGRKLADLAYSSGNKAFSSFMSEIPEFQAQSRKHSLKTQLSSDRKVGFELARVSTLQEPACFAYGCRWAGQASASAYAEVFDLRRLVRWQLRCEQYHGVSSAALFAGRAVGLYVAAEAAEKGGKATKEANKISVAVRRGLNALSLNYRPASRKISLHLQATGGLLLCKSRSGELKLLYELQKETNGYLFSYQPLGRANTLLCNRVSDVALRCSFSRLVGYLHVQSFGAGLRAVARAGWAVGGAAVGVFTVLGARDFGLDVMAL